MSSPGVDSERLHGSLRMQQRLLRGADRLLDYVGVDAAQYRWLLSASLRMDFRTKNRWTANKPGSATKSGLLWMVAFNLIMGLLFSGWLLLQSPSTFAFSAVSLGYGMTTIAMSVLIEFGSIVTSPEDISVLAHLPISSRTFFAAKLSNLLLYVFSWNCSVSFAPCFAGIVCLDSRWYFPFIYLIASSMSSLLITAAIVALYGVVLRQTSRDIKDLLVYVQVAVAFFAFFGYHLFSRLIGQAMHGEIQNVARGWGALFPSLWFAGLVELGLSHASREVFWLGLAALGALMALLPSTLKCVSWEYLAHTRQSQELSLQPARDGGSNRPNMLLARALHHLCFRHPEERAFFWLTLTMLRRNRVARMQIYPVAGIVLAILGIILLESNSFTDPFQVGNLGPATILSMMIFLYPLSGIAAVLPYSNEAEGAWCFLAAPLARPAAVLKAVRVSLWLVLLIPLVVVNLCIFATLWPVVHALGQTLYGLALGVVVLEIWLLTFRGHPFSRKFERSSRTRQLLGLAPLLVLLLSQLALPNPFALSAFGFSLALGILFAASFVLGIVNTRLYAQSAMNWLQVTR